MESDTEGNLLRFVDRVEFPAAAPGESFGRWPDGIGNLYPMTRNTLSLFNSSNGNSVRIGPVVISEIHYNPDGPDDDREFIIVTNTGPSTQNLSAWRMRGEVDYDFGDGVELAAGASITIIGFDPGDASTLAAFRQAYEASPASGFVGPWLTGATIGGKLNDGGGGVRLLSPGTLVENDGTEPYVPFYMEDSAVWYDTSDWPAAADGGGMALHRVRPFDRGDLAQSWADGVPFRATGPTQPSLPGYDNWAAGIFPAGTPEANTAPNADYDGDSISNSAEYAFATNPLVADAPAAVPAMSVVEDRLQIEFRMRETSPLNYAVSQSTDLLNWSTVADSDLDVLNTVPVGDGVGASRIVRLKASVSASAFYRISATR
ncbi:MAG: lamin tail domain-containing protein [Verrucomicrobiales bacterium]